MKPKSISIIGATGVVGRELIEILAQRKFPVSKLKLFASEKSQGELIMFNDEDFLVAELKSAAQIDTDLAFFAAGGALANNFCDKVAKNGTVCIDKSGALRMRHDVALIVAEVNAEVLAQKKFSIIASPNCVATPLCQALAPINKISPIKSVVVSTYQAVSGAGKAGSDELEEQVRDLFNLREHKSAVFGKRIAFNLLPMIPAKSKLSELGKTEEEWKVIEECQKILNLPKLKMEVTAVRVPVFNGHSMSVNIATENKIEINEAKEVLKNAPGLILVDDIKNGLYPTPLDASGEDMTLVGRIRPNTAVENGLSLWLSSDNLRTGAALNAVKIAEKLLTE